MIHIHRGSALDVQTEAVLRAIRTDLSPVSPASRDLGHAAGSIVEEHLGRLGSLPLGGAVITPAGDLACDFLIHAVVMSDDEAQTSATVVRAVRNSLRRAVDWGVGSLALPPLGIGVGTTEPEDAARTLVEILSDHLHEGTPPGELTVVVSSDFEESLFRRLVQDFGGDEAGS
ncbi:MAG: macro domain-containing protein [Longimicrobiales bacterium]|nr:macro domain-containing protein [Longimicrobiales bacterium]